MREQNLQGLTRRELLARGGFAVVTVGAAPALLARRARAAQAAVGGTIDFLSWEGYDIPGPMKAWKKAHKVNVKATYIGNHDDIQAKIIASRGAKGYDLITYYQGYKDLYDTLKIITPIDEEKIPNLKNELPYFAAKNRFWKDADGTRTGVPWTWGSIGITYDSAKIKQLSSWYDLLDPKFKGKIAMVDDPVGSFTLTAHILKLDPARVTQAQLPRIIGFLKKMLGQTKGVSPSFGDMTNKLVSGDAVACYQGWAAMNSFAAAAGKKTVKTNLPKEGSFSFCDLYAVPPTADNRDTVYAWINAALDPRINAAAAEYLVAGVTAKGAVKLLDKATASLYPYAHLDELLHRAPLYANPPVKSDKYVTVKQWIDKWQELKSSA